MCGLIAWCNFDGAKIDICSLRLATDSLRHRGPDDEGFLLANCQTGTIESFAGPDTVPEVHLKPIEAAHHGTWNCALGFRRLAILDRSAAGHQPMQYADGKLWIVFNGEVYNYLELRRELQTHGYTFLSNTDTEVVLAAYHKWGPECLNRFNGMWAFVIWDRRRNCLFLARDRFGIKPLYYYWSPIGRLAVASEIKALLATGTVAPQPDASAVSRFLALGWQPYPHSGRTFFEGINSLPPAHFAVVDQSDLRVCRYWELPCPADGDSKVHPRRVDAICQEYYATLYEAVRVHTRSDVPVGTCLSGGLDSTAVALLLRDVAEASNSDSQDGKCITRRTFSAVYSIPGPWNERFYIDQVVKAVQTDAYYVEPSAHELWNEIENVVWYLDEPFFSLGIYAQWCVMRLAKQTGTVVLLDGQGGDELLGGYGAARYQIFNSLTKGKIFDAASQAGLSVMNGSRCRRLSKQFFGAIADLLWAITKRSLLLRAAKRRNAYWKRIANESPLNSDAKALLYQPDDAARETLYGSDLHCVLRDWLTVSMLPQLLRYEDRTSMAHSRESRVPYLDVRLVHFVFEKALPLLIRDGWSKWIHRKAFDQKLPDDVVWRKDKVGFDIPELAWLRTGIDRVRDIFYPASPVAGFLHLDHVHQKLDTIQQTNVARSVHRAVWRWICCALWLEQFSNRERLFSRFSQNHVYPTVSFLHSVTSGAKH